MPNSDKFANPGDHNNSTSEILNIIESPLLYTPIFPISIRPSLPYADHQMRTSLSSRSASSQSGRRRRPEYYGETNGTSMFTLVRHTSLRCTRSRTLHAEFLGHVWVRDHIIQ